MAFSITVVAQSRGKAQVFALGVISGRDVFGITFTPDGKRAYFCQTDPEIKHIQILESHRTREGWSEPKAASFSPETYRDIDPFVTTDGKHLIFESNRPFAGRAESRTDFDVYIMDRKGSGWSEPRSHAELNSQENDVFVSATADQAFYFSSERSGGKGKSTQFGAMASWSTSKP
jgi:WD40-like Beta Propeller Repeat.